MKLVQKIFLKETREYEIVDDLVRIRIKSFLKEEKLTVVLSMINPQPVTNGDFLEFRSRVKSDPLLSLRLNKPDTATFNRFVDQLKLRAADEYSAFAGLKSGTPASTVPGNSFDDPPDFGDERKPLAAGKKVSLASLDSSIEMLRTHLDVDQIDPLIQALEYLKTEPESEDAFNQLVNAFNNLGPQQGAVLTYAPYVSLLLSDDPFGF